MAARSSVTIVLTTLLIGHVVWGLARLPKVYGRRIDAVERFETKGVAGYFLDEKHLKGAAAVQWILDHTDPQCVVAWRGGLQGAIELVPGMIHPRLLVREGALAAGATDYRGRPLAQRDGKVVVLAANGNEVELATR